MNNSNDNNRKRDMFKHGLDKVTSKLGLSSHSQARPSYLFNHDALVPSITNSLSVMPAVSQGHKEAFCPEPSPTQGVENQEETRYRAPLTPGSVGDQKAPIASRLSSVPLPKRKKNNDEKKDDEKKQNTNKLQDNKTGGKSGNK